MADESEVDTKSSPNTLSPPKTPTTPSNGGSGDLLTIDSGWGVGRLSRRSSLRASITSIDSAAPALKKEHFQLQVMKLKICIFCYINLPYQKQKASFL